MGNIAETESFASGVTPILVTTTNKNDENGKNKKEMNWTINKIIQRSNYTHMLANKSKEYDNNSAFWKFVESKGLNNDDLPEMSHILYNKTKLVKNLSYDQIASILLYNSVHIQKMMNESLNEQSDEWAVFCAPLLCALHKLPFQYKTSSVYRWIPTQTAVNNIAYNIGDILTFEKFTTFSQSESIKTADLAYGFMFEIQNGFRGRNISTFVNQKPQKQILFNISSHFQINKIYSKSGVRYIRCTQVPIPCNKKTVVWVDDKPQNNRELMQAFESNGIMIIPQISTKGALTYLQTIKNMISSHMFNQFRIITDMHRYEYMDDDISALEHKTQDKKAGINLIKELQRRGYTNRVCIFTGEKSRDRTVQSCKDENIYDEFEDKVTVTYTDHTLERFATFKSMNYVQLQNMFSSSATTVLPAAVLQVVLEFLNVCTLVLNEDIVIKIRYNNGDDSFGNFWEQSITFNAENDGDLGQNSLQRIGIVSHYNLNRMSNENVYTERQTAFIFEIVNESVPEYMMDFLNCDKNEITQKKMDEIRNMQIKYVNNIDCVKIVCKGRYKNNEENAYELDEMDEYFRQSIMIPCHKLLEIFDCDMNDMNESKEFSIRNEYTQTNPHLYECADLTVTNGYIKDPLNANRR